MPRSLPLLLTLAALLSVPARLPAQDYIWLEGESPTRANVKFSATGWGNAHYLSGGKWLYGSVEAKDLEAKIPKGGAVLTYEFRAKRGGTYEVWGRVGYEFVRSPFRWRIDHQPWKLSKPEELTTDLMALADWNEVAWLQLGKVRLAKGRHALQLRWDRTYLDKGGKKEPQHILFGLDCLCLYRGKFRPNGKFKPDEDWRSADDKKAARQTFRVQGKGNAGERMVTPLSGLWQVARFDEQVIKDRAGPVRELPDDYADRFWKAIRVPGNRDEVRPDLLYCHRFLYRTRVHIPARLEGRSFYLRFPSTVLIASVIVNGKYCGYSKAPCTKWTCDITRAVRLGKVNDVCVAVKDLYYALPEAGDGKSIRSVFNYPVSWFYDKTGGLTGPTRLADFPVLFRVRHSGIIEPPSLVTCGQAYTADVFAMPSVKKHRLGLEVTVHNPTRSALTVQIANHVVPLGKKKAEKIFAVHKLKILPGRDRTVRLSEKWADPKLWWPDDPHQYYVVTRLSVGGKVIDVKRTKFGFREWEWTGQAFKLNGVPWHLRADLLHNSTKTPERAVKEWRKSGQNMFRYWGDRPWTGPTQEDTLDFFDAHGVPVRRSGIFDGEVASYLLVETKNNVTVARKALFDNWIHQLRAWVKAERNHPSVFIWSVENEITYINARNFGWLPQVEPEIRRAVRAVMELDPTRPAMIDGGDALRDRSLPVYGNHYLESPLREYPDEAYTFARALRRHRTDPGPNPWPIGDDRPLFLGESFFVSGGTPAMFAEVGGDGAFISWPDARGGVGRAVRMLAEGYRWHGVAAVHFWLGPDNTTAHYNSWQPVCALCRQWNWTFGGGRQVARTLKVFNDTRYPDPVELRWLLTVKGKPVAQGRKTFRLDPGHSRETTISFRVPAVKERTPGELVLTCHRKGAEVFRAVKKLWVIDPEGAARPALTRRELAVWDPKGVVKARFKNRGIAFTEIAAPPRALPAEVKVLVVGPDVLTPRLATDPLWQALAARGVRVLVLDQKNPLHYQAAPADFEVTDHTGRVAFSENLEHPIFAGLGQEDFFTWSGDHVVYRNAYKKASKGARSLVQCDQELSCSAVAECPVKGGLLLLCQLAVGRKLDADPVARRLFDNMLHYCAAYRPVAKRTAVVLGKDALKAKLLDAIGLRQHKAADVRAALTDAKNEIVIVAATPENLKQLAARPKEVKAFTARGGWLMLWGLTPAGLADFNRLVGRRHVLRPFRMERVTLRARRDPVTAGLTMRDVVMDSGRQIDPWAGAKYPADDCFTYVVDLDDIAPFCTCPKEAYGWAQMTNGLLSSDHWRFIFSHNLKSNPHPKWTARVPKPVEVIEFSIVPNTFYHHLTKMRLVFDGNPKTAAVFYLKPSMTLQVFPLRKRQVARTITLEPLEWRSVGSQPVISVENIWIRVKRSPSYYRDVRPLLNIGTLVKYRLGKGGILLNQVRVLGREANPVNAQKKQTIVATLLRNLGAAFAAEKSVVAGANLKYQPIPLGAKCNQYLTAKKGWFKGKLDLGHFPVGENKMAGVRYLIRDFKTSPLPSCLMLGGDAANGKLPAAVKDIPVKRKADVLFFLHTFHQTREWKPALTGGQRTPPVVFQYVVHYADGKTAVVPVRYGRGVGHWVADEPRGLPEAAVAWAAPFPTDAKKQAVVYQMQWTNPRPGVEIRSLDLRYDPKVGNTYGTPAVLGITAATSMK
jgi:beta-galactosidase